MASMLVVISVALAGCDTASERHEQEESATGEVVSFEASDGTRLSGRIFGDGRVGVIFAHMGRAGDTQTDWLPLARAVAARGYTALTYNRRGVCNRSGKECSDGPDDYATSWKDVLGASHFVRSRGVKAVVLVGASIGAMSMLYATATNRVAADALVEIGGVNHRSGYDFTREQLEEIQGAKLFISSALDSYGGADAAREWYGWARQPKRLEIFDGGAHGTELLLTTEPTAKPLIELVVRFLEQAAPPGSD